MAENTSNDSTIISEDGTRVDFVDQDGNPCPRSRAATMYVIQPNGTRLTIDMTGEDEPDEPGPNAGE